MRDQEGTAIRHALYRPVCTCGWRGFSGCVVHPSLSERVAERFSNGSGAQARLVGTRSESDEQEPRP